MSVPDKSPPPHPNIARLEDLLSYMQAHGNDMQPVAQKMIPEISGIIALLKKTKHCLYAGMSGSGATCFGIFKNERECEQARVEIVRGNQDIWCVSTKLTTQ
jgi:4-diphosphocytidyl-2-C-methyl-D-erythritol kinase